MQITSLETSLRAQSEIVRNTRGFLAEHLRSSFWSMSADRRWGNSQIGARSSKCTCPIKTIMKDNSLIVNKLCFNTNIDSKGLRFLVGWI